jgi:hypothetical protein
MHQVAVVALFRRRAEPDVEIQLRGRRSEVFAADAPARLASVALGDEQLAVPGKASAVPGEAAHRAALPMADVRRNSRPEL